MSHPVDALDSPSVDSETDPLLPPSQSTSSEDASLSVGKTNGELIISIVFTLRSNLGIPEVATGEFFDNVPHIKRQLGETTGVLLVFQLQACQCYRSL